MSTLRLVPERHIAGGETIARGDDGKVVFVRGALPGETVDVEVVDAKRDWSRAMTVDVVVASADRVVPPCTHRLEGCGGCDWQHLVAPAQLDAKLAITTEALVRTGRLVDPAVVAGGSVPAREYRTTIRLVGRPNGHAGYRIERSHDTVDASGCLVAHPTLVALLPDLRISPGLEVTLRTSAATGEVTALWDPRRGSVDGLPDTVATGRDAVLWEVVATRRLRVSAGSFFQSGPAAAELLVAAVHEAAPELDVASHVVDAYAGIGLFAATVAPGGARLTLLESSRSSIGDARVNLDGRDVNLVRGEVGGWRADPRHPVDVVVADPARSGLGKPGVRSLAAADPAVIALVSCDPVSLARDAALLHAAGYRHEHTTVIDVFPHTHHVEAVTRFARGTLTR